MTDDRIDPDMTDSQFKAELLQALLYIGDGLHKIADSKIAESELLAGEDELESEAAQLNGRVGRIVRPS